MNPIVFVHGFMGGSAQWVPQETAFGSASVVAVDLPGYGQNAHLSPLPTIEAYSDWVLSELIRRGISCFDLIGHSMGGMIAQEMVAQAPDHIGRLVLYGTGAQGVLPGRFETIETSKKRALSEGAKATARRISATWFLAREDDPAYEGCAVIAEQSSAAAIVAGLEAMRKWDGRAHLKSLDKETLILWGDHDRTYSWEQTEQLWHTITRSNLAVIPLCAHTAHLERSGLFNSIVSAFLAPSS